MKVVRKLLTPDEITPPTLRYNVDCDCVQQTADGGVTWVDVPAADPRHADGFRVPPLDIPDAQCNAAANMVAKLRFFVDTDLASASIVSLASAILAGILLFVPGVGVIVDAILIAADAILTIGAGSIAAAFTESVYDDFLCIFVCNIDEDGQMSEAQLAMIVSLVNAQFDSVVQAVFAAHNSTMGSVGWSNAGALGESTDADCSACACGWAAVLDTCTSIPGWLTMTAGDQTSDGIQMANEAGWASAVQLDGTIVTTGSTVIDSIGIYFNAVGGIDTEYRLYINSDTVHFTVSNLSTGLAEITALDLPAGSYALHIIADNAATGVVGLVTGVRFTGTGANPFPDDPDVTPPCQP